MSKHSFNVARGARKEQPDQDTSLGLTEAFAPIGSGGSSADNGTADGDTNLGLTEAFAPVPASHGAHAGGFKYQGDTSEDYADPVESLEPRDEPVFGDEVPVPRRRPRARPRRAASFPPRARSSPRRRS